jgi:hypothetical protein
MTIIVAVLLLWARLDRAQCDSRDAFDGFLRRGQSAVEAGYTVPYFLLGRGHGGNNEWLAFLKISGPSKGTIQINSATVAPDQHTRHKFWN